MQLVRTWTDIEENLRTLDGYRHSQDYEDRKFYNDRIKNGLCFVFHRENEKLLIGPSRFVGYIGNTRERHIANGDKDGKLTNPTITGILGYPPTENRSLDQEHQKLCYELGVKPVAKTRKFWLRSNI